MIYAPVNASCCKVSLDKVVDYGNFWHAIFMILLVRTSPHEMAVQQWADRRSIVRVTEKIQLMLHKFTIDGNVD